MQFSIYLFLLLWKDEPWIFWSMTPTHPVRSYTLRVALQWISRKKRSFWSRGAHQDARYYIAELYCPREDRIKFRMIVLSHLWWHLPFGNIDVSITLILPIFTWWHLCGKTCGWKLYAFRSVSIRDDRLNDISARLNWTTAIFANQ